MWRSGTVTKVARFGTAMLERLEKVGASFSSAIIMAAMFMITADVLMRYVFNHPMAGAYESAELMMPGIVFLAIAYVQSRRGHINIDFFTGPLSQGTKAVLDIFGLAVGLFIFPIVTWQGGIQFWKAWVTGDHSMGIVKVPFWPGWLMFTFGSGLLSLQLLFHIVGDSLSLIWSKQQTSKGQAVHSNDS
jgi:TRAP-type C4-dicarboxylate transport system permease small subunit